MLVKDKIILPFFKKYSDATNILQYSIVGYNIIIFHYIVYFISLIHKSMRKNMYLHCTTNIQYKSRKIFTKYFSNKTLLITIRNLLRISII